MNAESDSTRMPGAGGPSHTVLAAGEMIDHYRIESVIGRGGMGVVYRAWDCSLQRTVAVKVLAWAAVEPYRSRLFREAQLAGRLRHPNVISVHACGEDRGVAFIVMDYVPGMDLRALVALDGPLPRARALRLLHQVASALDTAHAPEDGVVLHRDVKPHNLLVDKAGREDECVYLADFGLARSERSPVDPEVSYEPGTGTPHYMSPEQVRGEELGPASDRYSFAAVAVFMLTGAPPYPRDTMVEAAAAHLHYPAPSVHERIPTLPVALDAVVAAGLAKDPAARPGSCREFVRLLEAACVEDGSTPSEGGTPTHLPVPLTSLIGRAAEIEEVRSRLRGARLLSLIGPGGVGKSRLALAVADGAAGLGQAALVELVGAGADAEPAAAIADAVGATRAAGQSTLAALTGHLGTAAWLLVLDNCEHLLDAAAEVVVAVLRACPGVRVLATSRVPLGVAGEVVVHVEPLRCPDVDVVDAASLVGVPAVELFLARAGATGVSVDLAGADGAAVAAICRHLDGIPLAVELAARRVRVMAPTKILQRLDDAMGFLTDGERSAPRRQRTLAATLRWTFDLLRAEEQAGLAALSVFAGGFDFDAAEFVLAGAEEDGASPADVLAALVDWSLVARHPEHPQRFRMVETTRAFAAGVLAEEGARPARTRHLAWCTSMVASARSAARTGGQQTGQAQLVLEIDNVRAALGHAAQATDATALFDLATPFAELMLDGRYAAEARTWVERGLRKDVDRATDRRLRLRAMLASSRIAVYQGDYMAGAATLAEALAAFEEAGDQTGAAACRLSLGYARYNHGDVDAAIDHWERGLAAARAVDDVGLQARLLCNLSQVAAERDQDWPRAAQLLEQARELAARAGDDPTERVVLTNLGEIAYQQGDLTKARELLEEAETRQRAAGDHRTWSDSLLKLGNVALAAGDVPAARARFLDALRVADRGGYRTKVLEDLEGLTRAEAAAGAHACAARLAGLADAAREALGEMRRGPDATEYWATLESSRTTLGEAYARHYAAGAADDLDSVVADLLAGPFA